MEERPLCEKQALPDLLQKNLVQTTIFAAVQSICIKWSICKENDHPLDDLEHLQSTIFCSNPDRAHLAKAICVASPSAADPMCESTGSRRCVGGGALLVLPVDVKLVLVQIQMGWHSLVLNGWCHSVRNSALM